MQNRRSADAFLESHIAQSDRDASALSIVLIDLDHFKSPNDEHSHAVGDEVLRAAADVRRQHTRAGDLGVRWGGEEFVMIPPDCDLPTARGVAERLRVAMGKLDLDHVAPASN